MQPRPHVSQRVPSTGLSFKLELATAAPGVQKQMLGEKLYPLIVMHQQELACNITDMVLEMDNIKLLQLLNSDRQLKIMIDKAMCALMGACRSSPLPVVPRIDVKDGAALAAMGDDSTR